MRRGITLDVLVLVGVSWLSLSAATAHAALHAFAYHDVRDDVTGSADPYVVSTANLVAHFSWLESNGYTPVSVDDILAAMAGERPLPDKPVLLSFDDGLASAYTHVFPLLKLFDYPAVVSVVTDWIENPQPVDYGGRSLDAAAFLTWEQLREMRASGLVEVASHTHDLHHGIRGNPQGNLQPAAVTRRFAAGTYEDDTVYVQRIEQDLARSVDVIAAQLGAAPRALAWPYGAYSRVALEIAARHGLSVTFGLGVALNQRVDPTMLAREVVTENPDLEHFSTSLLYPPSKPVVRAAQVDLDYVFDPDAAQQERNLDALVERIHALGISHVFLQAFADPDADGGAAAVYFPTQALPMRADLFNRVAWQLRTRALVSVYAWLPLLSFVGPDIDTHWRVLELSEGKAEPDADAEPRLSPFNEEARAFIASIYRDLAVHASFDGILFHDDGRLNEFEDASEAALTAYRQTLGPEFSIEEAHLDPALEARWARLKSRALVGLSADLADVVRAYRPDIRTARNLFATALLDPGSERYLAQNFDDYLEAYDLVALMAMPELEGVEQTQAFYAELVDVAARKRDGLSRTLFELQTVDWRSGAPLSAHELRDTMRWLQSMGVRHLGYYPDDFLGDHPQLELLRQGLSLARFPRSAR